MQKKLTLSLCLKKSLVDISLFKGKERVLAKSNPTFHFSDPENKKSFEKAQSFLLDSLGGKIGAIEQLQINNDNKQLIAMLNCMKPHLQQNANIIPVNVTDLLVESMRRKKKNGNFVIFNFDENVSEVYFLLEDKFKIPALTTDISFHEALNKMSSYLNPQENLNELQINKEDLYSGWQVFDQKLINSFRDSQGRQPSSNYDFSFLPTLKKFNNKIFLKEGFKKRTYSYKTPLNASDKILLYEKFFSETMFEINCKLSNLLGSIDQRIKSNCSYVFWGESFRSDLFKDSIEHLCKSHKLTCEKSIKPHDYSAIINSLETGGNLNQYSISEIDKIKLYDLAHVSLVTLP